MPVGGGGRREKSIPDKISEPRINFTSDRQFLQETEQHFVVAQRMGDVPRSQELVEVIIIIIFFFFFCKKWRREYD